MSDLIDRQTAIDQILRLTHYDTVRSLYEATVANKYDDYTDGIMDAIDVIVGLASAQPEREKGRWIYYPKASGSASSTAVHLFPVCSECGREHPVANYCPNCGAKMEDSDE